MTALVVGQILGIAAACGLNLYAAVAALGLLSRLGLIHELPPALRGLESAIVIGTAVILYIIEAVIDRIPHIDSLWDALHTLVRPVAAALLAIGILWAEPVDMVVAGSAIALLAALAVHAAKAGLRLALNATRVDFRPAWVSTGEDLAAIVIAFLAFQHPDAALFAAAVIALALVIAGPRLWRAFAFGMRCLRAWLRALFSPPRWVEGQELARGFRRLLPRPPLGAARPRATRAAVHGLRGVGAYRNGWLVFTVDGPLFLYRSFLRPRSTPLPPATAVTSHPGVWANVLRLTTSDGRQVTLFMLKDGPGPDLTVPELATATA